MNKFEEFLNTPVEPASVARWLSLASLSVFIFGATVSSAALQTADFTIQNTGAMYLSSQKQDASISAQISATSEKVRYNNETTIMWRTKNATNCTVKKNGEYFSSELNGNKTSGRIKKDTRFTIECSSNTGKANANLMVYVGKQTQKPTVKLSVSPTYVDRDATAKITWSSKLADKCTLMQGANQINSSLSGSMTSQNISNATVIWLSCENGGGSVVASYNIQLKN